jgi:hypothetical protein
MFNRRVDGADSGDSPLCSVSVVSETTDTEYSSDSSESIPSLASVIVQRANINEREDRLLAAVPKFEGDNKGYVRTSSISLLSPSISISPTSNLGILVAANNPATLSLIFDSED